MGSLFEERRPSEEDFGRNGLPSGEPVRSALITARGQLSVMEIGERDTQENSPFGSMDHEKALGNIIKGEAVFAFGDQMFTHDNEYVQVFSSLNGLKALPSRAGALDIRDMLTKLSSMYPEQPDMAKRMLCRIVRNSLIFQGVSDSNERFADVATHQKQLFARAIHGPVEIRVAAPVGPGQFLTYDVSMEPSDYTRETQGYGSSYGSTPVKKNLVEIVPVNLAFAASDFVREMKHYLKNPAFALAVNNPRIPQGSTGLAPFYHTAQMLSFAGIVFQTRLQSLFYILAQADGPGYLNSDAVVGLKEFANALPFLRDFAREFYPTAPNRHGMTLERMIYGQNLLMVAFDLLPLPLTASHMPEDGDLWRMLVNPEVRHALITLRNHLLTILFQEDTDKDFQSNLLNDHRAATSAMVGRVKTSQGYMPDNTKVPGLALQKQFVVATQFIGSIKADWLRQRSQIIGKVIESNQRGYSTACLS